VHAGSYPRDWLVTYEKTPKYFYHPPVPYRVKALLPDVRLIMTLRDPVLATCNLFSHNARVRWDGEAESDQAWAQEFEGWVHQGIVMYRNYTSCRTAFFQELASKLTAENVSTPNKCALVPRNFNDMWSCDVELVQAIEETLMVRCGEPTSAHTLGGGPFGTDSFIPLYSYADSWRRWTRVFPREQILAVVMEDFVRSPLVPQLLNIRRFLGLDDAFDEAAKLQKINQNLWGAKLRDVVIDEGLLNGTRPLSDGFPQQTKSCQRAFPRTIELLQALFVEQVPSMSSVACTSR
jgi:hypothetical protein